jgi:N-ethylmaleimide reductase
MAPLTRGRCDPYTSIPEAHTVEYYTQRASVGLLISEATVISKQAHGWFGAPGIYTEEQTEGNLSTLVVSPDPSLKNLIVCLGFVCMSGWKKVIDSVHAASGKFCMQLWHMGRQAHSGFFGLKPVSASPIGIQGENTIHGFVKVPYEVPVELDQAGIDQVIAEFKVAAENAKRAGVDCVELHGANGYLIDQFFQSVSNQRTDAYGGSFENRFRLARQVIETLFTVFDRRNVGIRLSPNGMFGSMGSEDNFEMFSYVISELNKMNVGFIHLMDGLAFGFHQKCKVFTLFDAKKLFNGSLIGNCGYTPLVAEGAIQSGSCDAIAFGRPLIANPDFVERVRNGYPLAEAPSYDKWYRQQGDDQSKNLTDFPAYKA